ncbi:MAG: swarming motility protein [Terrestrivirus sp.]|uniref:Swarming motility protein n=1 Tax=Terrestrivirus sp. TaxID=2487775 RepID=A0A3G4ZK95_9VIRU|nr:MAG: swarming motility protein [Terrestrivirus sp.]
MDYQETDNNWIEPFDNRIETDVLKPANLKEMVRGIKYFILFYDGFQCTDFMVFAYDSEVEEWFPYTNDMFFTNSFCNYHPSPIKMEVLGKEFCFPTAEHAFHANKCVNVEDVDKFVDPNLTADDAKKVGRQITLREDWEEVKRNVMRSVLLKKYEQNSDLLEILLKTGSAYLVEHLPEKGDAFWGDDHDGSGQNVLGQLLMEVREELGTELVPFRGENELVKELYASGSAIYL